MLAVWLVFLMLLVVQSGQQHVRREFLTSEWRPSVEPPTRGGVCDGSLGLCHRRHLSAAHIEVQYIQI